jgi:flagellar biosynthesis GTPase FlhF
MTQASHRGSEFTSMNVRAKEAEEKRKKRLNDKYAKAQQEEAERQEKERLEKMRIARIKNSTGADRSWQELQREEDTKRKDRIEQRKMELTGKAAYPATMAESVEKWKTKKTAPDEETNAPVVKAFVAQNPAEVSGRCFMTVNMTD